MKTNALRIFPLVLLLIWSLNSVAQEKWSLQKCIDHAFQYSLTLKQGELNLDRVELNRQNAIGQMLPNLNAQATHGYNWGQRIDPFTNQFATERIRSNSFGISTGANLFNGFRLQNSLKQSNADLQAGKADLEKMKNDLALNVATSFLTVLLNREFLAIAQHNLEMTDAQVKRIEKLVSAGQLPIGNLNEIKAQQAADNASLVSAENNVGLAMLSLMQMIQLTDEEMASFDIAQPDASEAETLSLMTNAEAAIQHALNNFPQVKSAEASIVSSDYGVKIAQGNRWPSLGASFSYGTGYSGASLVPVGDPILSDPFYIGYVEGSLTPVLSQQIMYADYETKPFSEQVNDNINQSLFFSLQIPIFNGFSTKNGIALARINQQNAQITLEQTKQQLRQEVQKAFADAQAAKASFDAARLSVDAAQKAFEFSKSRFENGVINTTEYGQAQMQLENAKATMVRSKYEFLFTARVLDFYMGKAITFK